MIARASIRIIFILGATYVLLCLVYFFAQKRYIYFPSNQDFTSCPGFSESEFVNYNGTRAYYTRVSDRLLVFYHGNAGSACDRDYLKDYFKLLGYSSLFVEYTGYSNDPRGPARDLLMADVRQVNEFLKTLSFKQLVLAGESLGAALAVYHSSIAGENKLLLVSPFDKLSNVGKIHYKFFPVSLFLREEYDTTKWIQNIGSVLIIHGTKDDIIPMRLGKSLYEQISAAEKQFVEVEQAGHNDIFWFDTARAAIYNYLKNN